MENDKIFLSINGKRRSLEWLLDNLPAATDVLVYNCPGLTALPDLPAATYVLVDNCPGLTALPDLPAATDVLVDNCPGLTALPDLPAATDVLVYNCPGLTALPDLPAATYVLVDNCPGLTALNGGTARGNDGKSYQAVAIKIRGAWRIVAGCRNLSVDEARSHWRNNPEASAVVEKLAIDIAAFESRSRTSTSIIAVP